MTSAQKETTEKRKYPRLKFDTEKMPVLKVGDKEYEIENISQGGIRLLKSKTIVFEDIVDGEVIFPDGEIIKIEGGIAWEHEDVVGLSFRDMLSEEMLDEKERVAFLQTKISIPKLASFEEPEPPPGYSKQDLMTLGFASELIDEWVTKGYIEPSVKKAEDPEGENFFSRFDLYAVKLFKYLVDRNVSEEEASLMIKILVQAEKRPGRYLYENAFLAFPSKIDFSTIPEETRNNMRIWLEDKNRLNEADRRKAKDLLKNFIPAVLREHSKILSISSSVFSNCTDILVVNFKKIRVQVDSTVAQ
jgi:hypothetical protein